ncbi:MAG TPA: hypothetical protein VK188_00320 [Holophaga sp.]|nr:hypothetical protein [Holophaga sp.]
MEEPRPSLLPPYEPPRITVYTSQEIVDQVGPALTCSISPCPADAG